MKKLPARANAIAVPLVLTMIMSLIISGISTYRATGPSPVFFTTWMYSWLISWVIAFPTVVFVLPLARKIVAKFVELPNLSK
jgi:hypothetical protein